MQVGKPGENLPRDVRGFALRHAPAILQPLAQAAPVKVLEQYIEMISNLFYA